MERRKDIDLLKGVAMIVIVLYHMGLLKSGYLGVDTFFVISGFLVFPKVVKQVLEGEFRYFRWLTSRIMRLLPSILIVSIICLVVGYIFWLPDDYENLSETIIASLAFSNNILSGITTRNYWDTVNGFKPFMHTWYLGILMEFYILVPFVAMVLKKLANVLHKTTFDLYVCGGGGVLSILSLLLFLMPQFTAGDKFYFIPFRFYELCVGGLVGLCGERLKKLRLKHVGVISFVALLVIFFIDVISFDATKIGVETAIIGAEKTTGSNLILPNNIFVLLTVVISCVYLVAAPAWTALQQSKIFPAIGARSFSVFIWHQVLLALYRYSVTSKVSGLFVVAFFIVLGLSSELNYRLVEQIKVSKKSIMVTAIGAVMVCGVSGLIYFRAGVVRDVPELGVTMDNVHRNMHAEYCDRVNRYDEDFTDKDDMKVLVIGNSFARDWGNVLLESKYADDIDISYSSECSEGLIGLIEAADRIFIFSDRNNVPDYLWEHVKNEDNVYGIGTKNFGTLNGNIYSHRYSPDYFEWTVALDPGYKELDDHWKEIWGDQYIKMIDPVLKDGRVRVFTDDKMYISQDCRHLTQAGARYYAEILDIGGLLGIKE